MSASLADDPLSVASPASGPFYVSPAGSDEADGRSPETPFATIQKAASLAQAGDTVFLRAGTYRETVRPANSGTKNKPITFTSYQGELAVIDGADPIEGWKLWRDQIYVAPMPGDWFSRATPGDGKNLHDPAVRNEADQVFVDGRMVMLARWPNTPSLDPSFPVKASTEKFLTKTRDKATNWTTSVVVDHDIDLSPESVVGAEIVFQPNYRAWSWILSGQVTELKDRQLTFRSRSDAGKDFNQDRHDDRARYILFNTLPLLDSPGEWFHEKKSGELYLWAPDGLALDGRVKARKRLYAFDLTDLNYITIRDLHLTACTITTDRESGGDNIGYDATGKPRYPWRNAASGFPARPLHRTDFKDAPSTGIVLENLHATYLSHFTDVSGHFFGQWSQSSGLVLSGYDHIVRGCTLRWSAGNAISLIGRGHRVLGNLIEDTGYAATDAGAIHTGVTERASSDHEIGWNTIRRVGRSAIVPRNFYRSNPRETSDWKSRIHHNDISAFGIQDWDVGGIYTAGPGHWLRVDHNQIYDAWENVDGLPQGGGYTASGIYPDYGNNWIIEFNAIWNVEWGVHLQNEAPGSPASYIVRHNTLAVRSLGGTSQPYGPFGVVKNSDAKLKDTLVVNNLIIAQDASPGFKPIDFASESSLDRIVENNVVGSDLAGLGLSGGNAWPAALVPTATATEIVNMAKKIRPPASGYPNLSPAESPSADATATIGAFPADAPPWPVGHTAWRKLKAE